MSYDTMVLLILLIPLLVFAVFSLSGKSIKTSWSGIIAGVSGSFIAILAIIIAYGYFFEFGKQGETYMHHIAWQFQWLQFNEKLSIDIGIVLDPISVMMLVVISMISAMVNIYSIKYMHGEERYKTYFAYLSLFTFSMLGLVVSVNLFQMYIFWELVGASSYLLIGFYFTKASAVAAAKKAFIVTRFADLGFLIGILMLSYGAETLNIFTLIDRLTTLGSPFLQSFAGPAFLGLSTLSWGLLLVFMGGAGKSAMFPLHIWLPDAMEGPTPVSALIHAATMVVAGVFLLARLFPIFAISAPDALQIVAYIGAFTALFAAIIATTQTDIKRVLAYSTISQIAFMVFALGVSGWGEGKNEGFTGSMFHLFTHAFFKALLFLGAGAIIHAVHSNEMKDMGGLRKSLPITHITFLLACLAIAGIPPFSGFFSKEAILNAAYHGSSLIFYVALITSGLTSFYMFRLYFMIFWNKNQGHDALHNHEKGQAAMSVPMIILAFGAVFAGLIPFGNFVSADGTVTELPFHLSFAIMPVSIGVAGILIAYFLYKKESTAPDRIIAGFGILYQWTYRKFYIDELYLFFTKKVLFQLVGRPAAWFDRNIVDGVINAFAWTSLGFSEKIKYLQNGRLQTYSAFFLAGVLILAVVLLYKFI